LSEDLAANVIEIGTRGGLRRDPAGERRFYLTSSCGVCGKGAPEFVRRQTPPQASSALSVTIEPEVVLAAPDRARREQAAFRHTGGLHATALFAADGALLVLRSFNVYAGSDRLAG
jgi:FdhD protein